MTETYRIPLTDNYYEQRTSVVYRAFAENGDLLYVGVTDCPSQRFSFHEWRTGWWHHVHRIDVSQEFLDRWVAEDAERKAIRDLQPICNRWFPLVPECAEDIEIEWRPYPYTYQERGLLNAGARAALTPASAEVAS